ncbi:MAG: DUF3124 domain-containing protein [bacterium]|nr:DUF3124 domain-containing protein [bacterium]
MRNFARQSVCLCVILLLAGCGGTPASPSLVNPSLPIADVADLSIVTGQMVFVPAYSQITIPLNGSVQALAVTLAIHNTDLEHPIIIRSVRYYDTQGALIREFVDEPVLLNALGTTGYVVGESGRTAGWGTNFIVEWAAEQPVYEPVIEALIYNNGGLEGFSFISPGRIISEQVP